MSLAAAMEVSTDAAVAPISSELEDIFTIKEEQRTALKAFLSRKHDFAPDWLWWELNDTSQLSTGQWCAADVGPLHQLKASSWTYMAELGVKKSDWSAWMCQTDDPPNHLPGFASSPFFMIGKMQAIIFIFGQG